MYTDDACTLQLAVTICVPDQFLVGQKVHSVQEKASNSTAAAYIGIEDENGTMYWGAGTNTDITRASIYALLSAYNNMIRE